MEWPFEGHCVLDCPTMARSRMSCAFLLGCLLHPVIDDVGIHWSWFLGSRSHDARWDQCQLMEDEVTFGTKNNEGMAVEQIVLFSTHLENPHFMGYYCTADKC